MMPDPPIYFYIPHAFWPTTLPQDASVNWSGFGLGLYAWTVQTYLRLKQAGLACQLVNELPQDGIVLLHRNAFRRHPDGIQGLPKRLLVCFQGDLYPHPDAHLHIVQNRTQENQALGAYFMAHWPQPGLLPRLESRGDRFTTIAFFGHATNLAVEFSSADWLQALRDLDLIWRPVVNTNSWNHHETLDTRWNDYRDVDAVVAVRSFQPVALARTQQYRHKPATKLYNAWLAGVPAILGLESGYRAERHHALDYLEVLSMADVVQALTRLKTDKEWRQAIVSQGQQRSDSITPAALTQAWLTFIQETLLPAYDRWCCQSPWQQHLTLYSQRLRYGSQRLLQRGRDWYSRRQPNEDKATSHVTGD